MPFPFADPNANAIIAQQQLELDARHMLANYDAQMVNLQAALQNAQWQCFNAQQQAAAATDPDSQAAAQNVNHPGAAGNRQPEFFVIMVPQNAPCASTTATGPAGRNTWPVNQ